MERDCLVIPFEEHELIVACDSLGGIGPKAGDALSVPLDVSARFTARVALSEVLAADADPIALSVTVSIEPFPWLEAVQQGILRELESIGKTHIPLLFSSEKNVPTYATGLGVTAIGKRPRGKKPQEPQEGFLYALGIPSCGMDVLKNSDHIADLRDILWIREHFPEAPILPVGSQGIFREALNFLRGTSLVLHLTREPSFSLYHSCGPATVLLFATQGNVSHPAKPLWVVGELRAQAPPKR